MINEPELLVKSSVQMEKPVMVDFEVLTDYHDKVMKIFKDLLSNSDKNMQIKKSEASA